MTMWFIRRREKIILRTSLAHLEIQFIECAMNLLIIHNWFVEVRSFLLCFKRTKQLVSGAGCGHCKAVAHTHLWYDLQSTEMYIVTWMRHSQTLPPFVRYSECEWMWMQAPSSRQHRFTWHMWQQQKLNEKAEKLSKSDERRGEFGFFSSNLFIFSIFSFNFLTIILRICTYFARPHSGESVSSACWMKYADFLHLNW